MPQPTRPMPAQTAAPPAAERQPVAKNVPPGRASSFYTTEAARRGWASDNRAVINKGFEHLLVMSGKVHGLGQDEAIACLRYVRVLRQNTWFAQWLERMMKLSDDGWLPTPMDVMNSFTNHMATSS